MSQFCIGVVEGFYGRPWRDEQRKELFVLLKEWDMTSYVYAPKDDKKHRSDWRTPYDQDELAHLAGLIEDAQQKDIEFIYAISPGLDIRYSSKDDLTALKAKVDQIAGLGCNSFAILFDDIDPHMFNEDMSAFANLANAQAAIANSLLEHLSCRRMMFCPTEYCASRAVPNVSESEYLNTLGQRLDSSIEVFWTGSGVIPQEISVDSIVELQRVLRRKPVIWDNIHANDYDTRRVFLGPYFGRPWELKEHVAGILTNPNNEFSANFVALHTLAAWAKEGPSFDPHVALKNALADWLPRFQQASPKDRLTAEDLSLLVDFFYLPHNYGDRAMEFLTQLEWLLANVHRKDDQWFESCKRLRHTCAVLIGIFDKLSLLTGDIVTDLYPYAYDAKEVAKQCDALLERLMSDTKSRPIQQKLKRTGNQGNFGGCLSAIQDMLPSLHATEIDGEVVELDVREDEEGFFTRPFEDADLDDLYKICLHVGNAGDDASPMLPDYPRALGDRWVGPYIHLAGTLAFTLHDDEGVCGYVVAAINSETFYNQMEETYLPEVRKHYPKPSNTLDRPSFQERSLMEIWNPTFRYTNEMRRTYPSHLRINVLPRAQNRGNGKRLMAKMIAALQEAGSVGVHLELERANNQALVFFMKLGFSDLCVDSSTDGPMHLGRKLDVPLTAPPP